jgi:hypothetical protein
MARPRKKVIVKNVNNDFQDECVKRISECENVISHLETCPAWEVIQRDLRLQKQYIDDNWWKLKEGSPELQELRITALAYMHLLDLNAKYVQDLDNAKQQLDILQNADKKIAKDYDGA